MTWAGRRKRGSHSEELVDVQGGGGGFCCLYMHAEMAHSSACTVASADDSRLPA